MAEVLSSARRVWRPAQLWAGLWPVDKLILAYLAGASLLTAAAWSRLPQPLGLIAFHAVCAIFIVEVSRWTGPGSSGLRHWYPLPLVASCYKEMAILIPAVRNGATADQWLANADFSIWHANPTVWLEGLQAPWLTGFLQITYTLFVPVVLLIPWLVWKKRRFGDFRYLAFLIALGFLASYAGYVLVPARGPRFLLDHLQRGPLEGGWLVHVMRAGLDKLESAHYDCFPSGHTELTIIAWWSSRQISKKLFLAYMVYTLCIIFATVYLRYHYTVDILAGAVLAAVLIAAAPAMYRKLSGEGSIGS